MLTTRFERTEESFCIRAESYEGGRGITAQTKPLASEERRVVGGEEAEEWEGWIMATREEVKIDRTGVRGRRGGGGWGAVELACIDSREMLSGKSSEST